MALKLLLALGLCCQKKGSKYANYMKFVYTCQFTGGQIWETFDA